LERGRTRALIGISRGKSGLKDKTDYSGMTVNERLYAAGLLEAWDAAAKSRDRNRMIELLNEIDLSNQAESISDKILANPKFYGF